MAPQAIPNGGQNLQKCEVTPRHVNDSHHTNDASVTTFHVPDDYMRPLNHTSNLAPWTRTLWSTTFLTPSPGGRVSLSHNSRQRGLETPNRIRIPPCSHLKYKVSGGAPHSEYLAGRCLGRIDCAQSDLGQIKPMAD